MCCHHDHFHSMYNAAEQKIELGPQSSTQFLLQTVQRMELIEKVAELADELFHLLREPLQSLLSTEIFDHLNTIHHGAHGLEHLLHSFCFINDLVHIADGSFSRGTTETLAAKVFHLASHSIAAVNLLNDFNIIQLGEKAPALQIIASAFSCMGFGIMTITLVANKIFSEHHKPTWIEIGVHASGCCYHFIAVIQVTIVPFGTIQAVAGVAHAALAIYRLLPATSIDITREMKEQIRNS